MTSPYVNCNDLLTVVVQSILILAAPSSEVDILTIAAGICAGTTLADIQTALSRGVKCGVLVKCTQPPDTVTILYEINNNMRQMKAGNDIYYYIVNPAAAITPPCN